MQSNHKVIKTSISSCISILIRYVLHALRKICQEVFVNISPYLER